MKYENVFFSSLVLALSFSCYAMDNGCGEMAKGVIGKYVDKNGCVTSPVMELMKADNLLEKNTTNLSLDQAIKITQGSWRKRDYDHDGKGFTPEQIKACDKGWKELKVEECVTSDKKEGYTGVLFHCNLITMATLALLIEKTRNKKSIKTLLFLRSNKNTPEQGTIRQKPEDYNNVVKLAWPNSSCETVTEDSKPKNRREVFEFFCDKTPFNKTAKKLEIIGVDRDNASKWFSENNKKHGKLILFGTYLDLFLPKLLEITGTDCEIEGSSSSIPKKFMPFCGEGLRNERRETQFRRNIIASALDGLGKLKKASDKNKWGLL